MLNKNMKIVLFCLSLYVVAMILTIFWIIPTLKFIFKLEVIGITVLLITTTLIYSGLIMRLMIYLGSKDEIIIKLESRKGGM